MAILSITKQYSKAVFIDHTRTLDAVPTSYQSDVKDYAAGILIVNGIPQPSGYYVETIDETLDAGKITTAQHDEILSKNPNMAQKVVAAVVVAE
jgi:hypothetical protein